jgi:tripartite-type tricarboxylate transporter receptor subunit TctC
MSPIGGSRRHDVIKKGENTMLIQRRSLIAATMTLAATRPLHAQGFPTHAIRVIVPYAPGATDLYVRPLQQSISQALGQPVIVDTVAGSGGGIGANRVRNSPPDGHTLLFAGTAALTIVPRLQPGLGYALDDFAPVCHIVQTPMMIAAGRRARFRTIQEMLRLAKQEPESISYGTAGIGSSQHLAVEAMAQAAGVKLLHVPYSGFGPALTALVAGDLDLAAGAPLAIMPMADAHGLIPLAHTGPRRLATLPNVPTLLESGLNVELVSRFGLFAPKQTPPAILDRLTQVFLAAATPAYVETMQRSFNEVAPMDQATFREVLAVEDRASAKLLTSLGLP